MKRERVFFPFFGPTLHLSQPPSIISGGRERKEAVKKAFQCGFQGRFPGPGDTSVVTENALTRMSLLMSGLALLDLFFQTFLTHGYIQPPVLFCAINRTS